jgi:hypothetical protein
MIAEVASLLLYMEVASTHDWTWLDSLSDSSLQKTDVTYISPLLKLERNGVNTAAVWRRRCKTMCRAYFSATTCRGVKGCGSLTGLSAQV